MIIITNWFGRLGNNIMQIINALHIAVHFNINKIILPNHKFLENKIFLNNLLKVSHSTKIIKSNFFYRKELMTKFNLSAKVFDNISIEHIRALVQNIFKIQDKINIKDDDLTIHIRSGDVYNSRPHPGWVQPPLWFYKKVIKYRKWNKIYLICEDTKSPVIKELLSLYPDIKFTCRSLKEDIISIISSTNLCFGFGSFIPALLTLNNTCKNIFYPEYCYRYLLHYNNCNTIKYKLPNYIKVGEWKNTTEQKKLMLNYKI